MNNTNYNFFTEKILNVEPYDIDIAGHVNNTVFVRWTEDLRIKFFSEFFSFDKMIEDRLYPVVISTNIEYRKQVKLKDNPVGIIRLIRFDRTIWVFKIEYKIEKKVIAKTEQKCVVINLDTNKIQKLNEVFFEKYAGIK